MPEPIDPVRGGRPPILSVSDLNRRARQLLETHYAQVWVAGELSNLVRPSSGHWYFTLKDAGAQVRCAMFRNRNQMLRFRPENGMKITLRGRLSLYEARGDYQLIAEHFEESGIGALQRAFEQLKETLRQRGWFDAAHKRALPSTPRHLGVVTSPSGAALHDILSVLQRRFPAIAVTVFPTSVQGAEAPAGIARAIALANHHGPRLEPPLEALIVGRGGGSLEDLWAFNEEVVAAAIHQSGLPVVSAVGHETDFTIADFVADHRAPTPSAAAELLSPDQARLRRVNADYRRQLSGLAQSALNRRRDGLKALRRRLVHPGTRLQQYAQRLDEAEQRLRRAQERLMARRRDRLNARCQNLLALSPGRRLPALERALAGQARQLQRQLTHQLEGRRQALDALAGLLNSVSPLHTLQRGYAIATDAEGNVLRNPAQVRSGDPLRLRLAEGELSATAD